MKKNHCKIYKNGKIYFWNVTQSKYNLFGCIDEFGIIFNIEKNVYNTFYGQVMRETIPNPSSMFYIELGEYLKKQNNLKW